MADRPVTTEEGAAVAKIPIGIVNECDADVEIFRRDPEDFTDELKAKLAPGQRRQMTVGLDDCLIAKVDDQLVGEYGVCAELGLWRVRAGDAQRGLHCQIIVANQRRQAVRLVCTEGDGGATKSHEEVQTGERRVVDSMTGDYWEATIGARIVSAYQPSWRLPVWNIIEVDSEFVPELPVFDYTDLNDTEEPRPIDLPAVGEVKAVMVFVDFEDFQVPDSPQEARDAIVGQAAEWFRVESYGRLQFSVDTPVLAWRRMPKPASEYKSIGGSAEEHKSYIATALTQFRADEIDFSNYQIVYIVAAKTPEEPKYDGVLANSPTLSNGQNIQTNNGVVKHVVTFGHDAYWRSFRVLVHETGHLFGLPDLYLFHPTDEKPHLGPAGVWDIMCDLDGGRHFLGWHRYKLGWLDESQLVYFRSGELVLTLTTMESAQGIKMIVLPSEYSSQLYIVEVAQELGEDGAFRDKGIVLYAVDGAVGTGHKPLEIVHCGAAVDDTNIGLRCGDYLAPSEKHEVALANGNRVEISNNRKVEDGFEVTVRVTGAQPGASVKPASCSHCGRPVRG